MPHVPYLPPGSRFFARLDKFACECPACGQLILSSFDSRDTPLRLATLSSRRYEAKIRPKDQSIRHLVWNPHTQRLKCPFCQKVCIVGLLAWTPASNKGWPQHNEQPSDAIPDRRQRLELRGQAGGFWAKPLYEPGDPVNLYVTTPCSCPFKGWAADCPVHGDPGEGGKCEPLVDKSSA